VLELQVIASMTLMMIVIVLETHVILAFWNAGVHTCRLMVLTR